MSGSPVYIDGRLVGAVSYALGPVCDRTDCGDHADRRDDGRGQPVTHCAWHAPGRDELAAYSSGSDGDLESRSRARAAVCRRSLASDARRVAGTRVCRRAWRRCCSRSRCRWSSAGFGADVLAPISDALTAAGFLPVSASAARSQSRSNGTPAERGFRPGEAMGVALMTGDFELGATGTVTYVDGDKVYGFGHPLYNLGPTQFPLTQADVHGRASQPAPVDQDRQLRRRHRHAAAGSRDGGLGHGSAADRRLIPVSLTLNSDRGGSRTFNFSVVKDVRPSRRSSPISRSRTC